MERLERGPMAPIYFFFQNKYIIIKTVRQMRRESWETSMLYISTVILVGKEDNNEPKLWSELRRELNAVQYFSILELSSSDMSTVCNYCPL
jgi:hypothetical protein